MTREAVISKIGYREELGIPAMLGKPNLTILGGGPAGLAVAFYANQSNCAFELFEKSDALGGLCRTLSCGAHRYDTGAHRFHDRDPEITRDLSSLMPGQLVTVSRPSKVWMSGRFLEFPPTPLGVLMSGSLRDAQRIGFDLVKARWHRRKVVSFADFAIQSFGRTLAERFLLNYSTKVWGLPPEQLSPAVATRRLSGMNLRTLLGELLTPGRRSNHLDGHFLYPRGGYGRIVETLAGSLPQDSLRTGHEVTGMGTFDGVITEVQLSNGMSCSVNGLVASTLPLTLLVEMLSPHLTATALSAARELRLRHIRLVFLRLARPRFTENASIYIPDPDLWISRIYEPRNRCDSMAPPDETGIVVEVPCFDNDEVAATSEEDLIERVTRELAGLRLLTDSEVLESRHHFLPNAYPVYSLDYEAEVGRILEELEAFENLETLGRNGLFFYSHLHDQLRMAKDFVSGILSGRMAASD